MNLHYVMYVNIYIYIYDLYGLRCIEKLFLVSLKMNNPCYVFRMRRGSMLNMVAYMCISIKTFARSGPVFPWYVRRGGVHYLSRTCVHICEWKIIVAVDEKWKHIICYVFKVTGRGILKSSSMISTNGSVHVYSNQRLVYTNLKWS